MSALHNHVRSSLQGSPAHAHVRQLRLLLLLPQGSLAHVAAPASARSTAPTWR